MAQIGFNAGSRISKVWGPAQSYVNAKGMDTNVKAAHDEDVIAALTMVWGLINTYMPLEVMDKVNASIKAAGMPRLATRNVPEGM